MSRTTNIFNHFFKILLNTACSEALEKSCGWCQHEKISCCPNEHREYSNVDFAVLGFLETLGPPQYMPLVVHGKCWYRVGFKLLCNQLFLKFTFCWQCKLYWVRVVLYSTFSQHFAIFRWYRCNFKQISAGVEIADEKGTLRDLSMGEKSKIVRFAEGRESLDIAKEHGRDHRTIKEHLLDSNAWRTRSDKGKGRNITAREMTRIKRV